MSRARRRPPAALRRGALAALLCGALAALAAAPAPAATPACFGAAARDAMNSCSNPTSSIVPALDDDDEQRGAARCKPVHEEPAPVCTFGYTGAHPSREVALIGDSHALHWRTALAVAARASHWRGHSITTSGCLFSAANDRLPPGAREPCMVWEPKALRWLRDHRRVSTLFVSQSIAMPVVPAPGKDVTATRVAGFQQLWKSLPRHVRRVIVIRDTPQTSAEIQDCLRRAVAAGSPPGPACPNPRADAVVQDTAATAARGLRSRRYGVIDLTDFFCDARDCFAVVGGVRVYRDTFGHITQTYSRTLGPYLLRAVRPLLRGS